MTVFQVLKYPHVLLKKPSKPITDFSEDLSSFVAIMEETMKAFDGIGLAAPQVGINRRLTVVDVRGYWSQKDIKDWRGTETFYDAQGKITEMEFPITFINPVIESAEGTVVFPWDGCLSFPGVNSVPSKRFSSIRVRAQNVKGEYFSVECTGIFCICLQHEIDHLDGVLFISRTVEAQDDKDILSWIEEEENDSKRRKKLRSLKPIDARKTQWKFALSE